MQDADIKEIINRADSIVSDHAERDNRLKRLDDVYLLRWPDRPEDPDIKLTMDPGPRNGVRGVTNLLTATSPQFTVPVDENSSEANEYNEQMERAMQALLANSNAVQMVDLEREVTHSLALYDEVYVSITCMADMVAALDNKPDDAAPGWMDAQVREAAEEAPYLFECIPPRCAYPLIGRTGLLAFVQKRKLTIAEVRERFGSAASPYVESKKVTDTIEVREYWDSVYHAVWLHVGSKPIISQRHKLGFIPIAMSFGSGTRLYDEQHYQRQPFLGTVLDSEIWQRKNTVLTATFNRLEALGLNVTFIHEKGSPDAEVEIDYSNSFGVMEVPVGSKVRLAADQLLDPNIMNALGIADRIIEESTVYKQSLGSPLAGTDTFSTVSLLSQSGRLPLTPIQEGAKKALSRMAQLTMRWIKNDGQGLTTYDGRKAIDIDPLLIPDRVVFDVILDVDLPQDMLRNANIAHMLKESGLVDSQWIHENILNVGQTVDMKKRVLAEMVADALSQQTVQQYMQMMEQAKQQAQQPPQGEEMPPQQPGRPGPVGGMPPEQMGELPMNEQPGGMPGEMMPPGMGGMV
jgi:hypothetical protein